jgi:ribonuclease HI
LEDEKLVLKGTAEHTTNNQMEIVAVIQAIHHIKDLSLDLARIEIYTDSQYVMGIPGRASKLKSNDFHTRRGTDIQNSQLVQTLLKLLEVYPVTFIKVASHQKRTDVHDYNREADMIARAAVRLYIKNSAHE